MSLRRGRYFLCISLFTVACGLSAAAQAPSSGDEKAREVLAKAVQVMGGDKYLQVKTQIGRGTYYLFRGGEKSNLKQIKGVAEFQKFTDILVFPDKERTEFKGGGTRNIQANSGDTGWLYDSDLESIKAQTPKQIADFRQSIRTSLDYFLRGYWKGDAKLTYGGRRPSTLGKRNDVLRLTFNDGFSIEFEFDDDGTPQKAAYKHTNAAGEVITEEDRFAQFLDVDGVKTPYIIDRFTDGQQASRINYDSVDFNKPVPDSVFAKPATAKEAKKDLKF